ncbi:DNA repair protein RecO [Nesterenkonia alkaliphila]|uniref:DNA repair protein RecO n=1 Tax=Nesterenkonia alkaliphila TaxID=1463631 RepID=A0A7K1UKV1_9MICC|nr:DNA repair protein RecO [Nesterenkonia alkaliphila]MVT27117.1 DNA repair protein RecO [Nesterenkonia alkaliphila]GFZ89189.1 DNA repair protein RecO [Nesterenkonia alkaliphila]
MAGSTFASRSYRDIGIVLRTQKLGEADRIITVLTAFHGLVRAVAKGVRRTSSKFGATLEPFMVADLQLVHGRSLDIITQAQGRSAYGTMIAADYEKYTVASAMAEAAERLTDAADTADRSQFDLLHGGYSALARGVHAPDLVLGSYLLRALSSAGWAVTWSVCVSCGEPGPHVGFHASAGGPVCPACRPPGTRNLPAGTPEFLHALQQGNWEQTAEAAPDIRHQAVEVVTDYAQHHLERRLTSLRAYAH